MEWDAQGRREVRDQEDQWETLEYKEKLDPEDSLVCLAYLDQQDRQESRETEDCRETSVLQASVTKDLLVHEVNRVTPDLLV